jgi:hypothetical protein
MNTKFDNMILILYVGLMVWLIYKLYKTFKAKKNLRADAEMYARKVTTMEYILFFLLESSGFINLYNGLMNKVSRVTVMGTVMIVMGLIFLATIKTKIYIDQDGILINGSYFTFKEVRKWGFDSKRGDLVLLVKKNTGEYREATQVNKEDIEAINKAIRKYKLGK